jgi:CheY-like chemotaxis protein
MSDAVSSELLKNIFRYASCILGNRQLSRIAIVEALKAQAINGGSSRFELYRAVNEAAVSSAPLAEVRFSGGCGIGTELLKLPHQRRQIVALRAVMGFSYGDVGEIMGMTEAAVRRAYVSSLLELRAKPAVLIIEDEAMIALDLQKIIKTLGLSVAGIAKNREEALRIVGLSHPKLIVADYRLRDETGIDVVNAIREQIHADVIYITAHPEAVTEQLGAASEVVLSKPFNARALVAAVQSKLAA